MSNLYFFFILFIFINVNSEIILQFKRRWSTDFSNENNIILNLQRNDIITKIKLGTPLQEGYLSLNFKDYSTYISVSNCSTETPKFNEKSSSSYSIIKGKNTYYYCGFMEGSISNDIINLNGLSIKDFNFISVYKLRQDNFFLTTELGVLGLNEKTTRPDSNLEKVNFIQELKSKNLIDSFAFSIKYNNENDGNLIIGNYPHEYNKSFTKENLIEISSHRILDNGEWGILFDNITSGDIEITDRYKIFSSCLYLEDGIFYSNNVYKKIIDHSFFNEYLNKNICVEKHIKSSFNFEYQFYICDNTIDIKKFPSLKFHLKNSNLVFEFNYNDLFDEYHNKIYFLVAFTKATNWRIGKQFFKKYTVVFNQDKRTIGFYKNSKNNVNFSLKLILLIILGIIIIFLLINIKYKKSLNLFKSKRIKANELEDDISYNNFTTNLIK